MHVKPPMKSLLIIAAGFLFVCLHTANVQAQATAVNRDPDSKFKQAQEYFLNDQYSLALPLLLELKQNVQTATVGNQYLQTEEIDFYILACRLQQNDERAVLPATDYIRFAFNHPRTQQLSYHLANYYFQETTICRCVGVL